MPLSPPPEDLTADQNAFSRQAFFHIQNTALSADAKLRLWNTTISDIDEATYDKTLKELGVDPTHGELLKSLRFKGPQAYAGKNVGALDVAGTLVDRTVSGYQKGKDFENKQSVNPYERMAPPPQEEQRPEDTFGSIVKQAGGLLSGASLNYYDPEKGTVTLPNFKGAFPEVIDPQADEARQKAYYADLQKSPGLLKQGNLDPFNRKILKNPDGSYSTTSSISIGTDAGEVLIPTVVDGKRLTKEQAVAHYQKTGEHLGIFDTPEHADAYAVQLHNQQESRIDDGSTIKIHSPLSEVLQRDWGVSPDVAQDGTADDIGRFVGIMAPWSRISREVSTILGIGEGAAIESATTALQKVNLSGEKIVSLDIPSKTLSVAKTILQNAGVQAATGGVYGMVENPPENENVADKVKRIGSTMLVAAGLSTIVDGLIATVLGHAASESAGYKAAENLRDRLSEILYKTGSYADETAAKKAAEVALSNYAGAIDRSHTYSGLADLLYKAGGYADQKDAYKAITDMLRDGGDDQLPDKIAQVLIQKGAYPTLDAADKAVREILNRPPRALGPSEDWAKGLTEKLDQLLPIAEEAKAAADREAKGKIGAPRQGPPTVSGPPPDPGEVRGPDFTMKPGGVAEPPPPRGAEPTTPEIQGTMTQPPAATTVRDGQILDSTPMDTAQVQGSPDANKPTPVADLLIKAVDEQKARWEEIQTLELAVGAAGGTAVKGDDAAKAAYAERLKKQKDQLKELQDTYTQAWDEIGVSFGAETSKHAQTQIEGPPKEEPKPIASQPAADALDLQGKTPTTRTPPPGATTGKPVTVTDNSVRDHSQQVKIAGDVITVNHKVGREKRGSSATISLSEWRAAEKGPSANPAWNKAKLLEKYFGHLDDEPGGPDQAARIRDSIGYAIDRALKSVDAVPPDTRTPPPPTEPQPQPPAYQYTDFQKFTDEQLFEEYLRAKRENNTEAIAAIQNEIEERKIDDEVGVEKPESRWAVTPSPGSAATQIGANDKAALITNPDGTYTAVLPDGRHLGPYAGMIEAITAADETQGYDSTAPDKPVGTADDPAVIPSTQQDNSLGDRWYMSPDSDSVEGESGKWFMDGESQEDANAAIEQNDDGEYVVETRSGHRLGPFENVQAAKQAAEALFPQPKVSGRTPPPALTDGSEPEEEGASPAETKAIASEFIQRQGDTDVTHVFDESKEEPEPIRTPPPSARPQEFTKGAEVEVQFPDPKNPGQSIWNKGAITEFDTLSGDYDVKVNGNELIGIKPEYIRKPKTEGQKFIEGGRGAKLPSSPKARKPTREERYANYFSRPGEVLPNGYWGDSIQDTLVKYDPETQNVTVSRREQTPEGYGPPRQVTHGTMPSERELAAWEKDHPVPAKEKQKAPRSGPKRPPRPAREIIESVIKDPPPPKATLDDIKARLRNRQSPSRPERTTEDTPQMRRRTGPPKQNSTDFTTLSSEEQEDILTLGTHLFRENPDWDAWSSEMTDAAGDWITPYLESSYDAIDEVIGQPEGPSAPEPAAAPPAPIVVATPEPEEQQPAAHGYTHFRVLRLINSIRDMLSAGTSINNPMLTAMANEAFGGTRGEGKYDPRDAYDAVEVAVNMVIREPGFVDFNDVTGTLSRLRLLTAQLPRQADRTTEQIEFQQFSTPPEEAFAAVIGAGITPGTSTLEPSGGNGNLATMQQLAGGIVNVNEISARRVQMLEALRFQPTSVDAQYLNDLLPDDIKPAVIVMNPPFSATGGRTKGHKTEYGADHVEQALARVEPGGRVVAIVGRGMAHERPGFMKWWNEIEQKYTVRANIGIDGKYYQKYGTGFDNQILVIDKTGPTPGETRADRLTGIVRSENLSPEEAIALLQPIGAEDVNERVRQYAERASQESAAGPLRPRPGSGGAPAGSTNISSSTRGQRPGQSPTGGGGAGSGAVGQVDNGGGATAGTGGGAPAAGNAEGGLPGTGASGGTPDLGVGVNDGNPGQPGTDVGLERGEVDRQTADDDSETYSKYVVRKATIKGSQPHQADIVESATLASVEPPEVTYTPHLPAEVATEGRLSAVQLEAVIYAGQRHQVVMRDGKRAGYWDGDGTGLGKGRTIAGVIYDNFMQGRKRAVWVTYQHGLREDAKRDLTDVGVPMKLHAQQDAEVKGELPDEDGVVLTTYGMLAGDWDGTRRRYNQLTKWLGEDYDGVIVFDEGHKLKNAVVGTPTNGPMGKQEGSNMGAMGLELDKTYPNARIMYVSATAATVPRNMAYMSRLGLWGAGSPFPDFQDFLNAMGSGGLGAMEMLARDLKATGGFISRSLSFRGVEYREVVHDLTPDETAAYDNMADIWVTIQGAFDAAAAKANSKHQRSRWLSQFYSAQLRFFLQVMTSLQLPDLYREADKDLAEGRSVVINLFSTNEGQVAQKVSEAIASGVDLDDMDFTPRQMLVNFVEKFFPVEVWTTQYNPVTGKDEPVQVVDENGNPVLSKENLAAQQALLDRIADVSVPDNPLDAIVNHFGPGKVSEVTGRTKRLEGGKYEKRKIKGVPLKYRDSHEVNRFQQGLTRVAVISAKASAGISLHSHLKAKNQQRRVFYAMQLSWSGDTQMQSFGRVHRSNQAEPPIIKLMRTSLKGQERLVNTVSARLASMGALTEGSRETKGGGLFAIQDLTDEYGKAALVQTYGDIGRDNIEGVVTGRQLLERMGLIKRNLQGQLGVMNNSDSMDVSRFLNRILALHVGEQNGVFNRFYEYYQQAIEMARNKGTFDPGVTKVKGTDIVLKSKPETLYVEPTSKAETQLVTLEGAFATGRIPWEKIEQWSKSDKSLGFVVNKKSQRIYLASIHAFSSGDYILLQSPTGAEHSIQSGVSSSARDVLRDQHTSLLPRDAAPLWATEFGKTPEYARKPIYLVTGAIFPIYDKVVGTDRQHLQRSEIVRAVLADGSKHVGLQIRQSEINGLKQRLGIGVELTKATAAQIYDMVQNKGVIVLDNDWKIRMTKVHGEPRMEVNPGRAYSPDEMRRYGLIEEIVDHKRRFFVPLDKTAGPEAIGKIIENHKAVRDETAGGKEHEAGRRSGGGGTTPPTTPPSPQDGPPAAPTPATPENAAEAAAAPQSPASMISKKDILAELAQKLGVPLRSGRFRKGRDVLGIFKVRQNVVRTKRALDLETALHEFGHAINKILWGTSGGRGLELNYKPLEPYRQELEQLATEPGPGQDALPEGFAEFIRLFIGDVNLARALAPKFAAFFEGEIEGTELKDTIANAQANIQRWNNQPSAAKINSNISIDEEAVTKSNRWASFYAAMVDRLDPIRRVTKSLGPLDLKDDPYKIARLVSGSTGKAFHALEKGTFDPITMVINGPGLLQILEPVDRRGRLDDFVTYMVAKRVIEKSAQGINTGFELADAQNVVRDWDEEFSEPAAAMVRFQNWLLDYITKRGLISEADRVAMVKLNQDYVPFYRVVEATIGDTPPRLGSKGSGSKYADLFSPTRRMVGSGRPIVHPLESIIKNVFTFINLAERNRVGVALVNAAAGVENIGHLIEGPLPPAMFPTTFPLDRIKATLEAANVDTEMIDLDQLATIFSPTGKGSPQENILAVMNNGTRQYYQVEPELYKALDGLNEETVGMLVKLAAIPARVLRLGAVGLSPEFLLRNPFKDAIDAMALTSHGFKPGIDSVRGIFHVLRRDDLYWEWMRSGAAGAAMTTMERTNLKETWQDLLKSKFGYMVSHPIDVLAMLGETTEAMTRVGEFALGRKHGASVEESGFSARNVTIDFGRRGYATVAMNLITAFWNATVQGTDRFLGQHKEKPSRTAITMLLGLTVPSLLLYMWNRKDPAYFKQPKYLRDTCWVISTKGTALEESLPFLAFPKPFLFGLVYATIPEKIMQWIDEKDPAAFDTMKEVASVSIDQALPGVIPSGLVPLAEAWANRSLLTGDPIIPQRLLDLPTKYRYEYYTSEIAKLLSDGLDKAGIEAAPISLDVMMRGYMGGMGRFILDASSPALRPLTGSPDPPAATWADLPLFRALAVRYPSGSLTSISQFYNRLDELREQAKVIKLGVRTGRTDLPDIGSMSVHDRVELGMLEGTSRHLSALQAQMRSAQNDTAISASDRRKRIDQIQLEVANVAEEGIFRAKAGNPYLKLPEEMRLTLPPSRLPPP